MKDFKNIGYLEKLKRRREALQAIKDATPDPPTLKEKITAWEKSLPDADQNRAWKMTELKALFGESAQRVGTTLWELGWSRRRSWKDNRPCSRYWFKE